MARIVEKSKGATFIQINPALGYEYLTCTGVGTIAIPKRSRKIVYCPDPQSAGDSLPAGFIRGEAGEVTCTLTRPLETVFNWLLELGCDFQFRLNHPCRGDRTIISNYQLAEMIYTAGFISGEVDEPMTLDPGEDDRILTSGEVSGLWHTFIYPLTGAAQVTPTATVANDIAFLPARCADRCGPARGIGQIGYVALATAGYLAADNVLYTLDYGGTWQATVADPWNGSRDALAVLLLELGSGYRVLVAGGTDAGQFAEVSYSDAVGNAAAGAAWTDVFVGTTVAQGINAFARDPIGRIYAAADTGMIYRSTNLGQTWTLIETGTTINNLNGIVWYSEQVGYAVGNANDTLLSIDSGITWALVVGPVVGQNLTDVVVNHAGHVYVSVADGTIYVSVDQGTNWTLVVDQTAGSINKIRLDKTRYFGGFVWDNATVNGYLFRSEDGGPTWFEQAYVANSGLNSLWVCDANLMYVCGNDHGGTTFIARYHRIAS